MQENEEKKTQEPDRLLGFLSVTLGGEERKVRKLSIWDSEAFMEKAGVLLGPIGKELMRHSQELVAVREQVKSGKISQQEMMDLFAEMIGSMSPYLMGAGFQAVIRLPFLYAPELEAYKDLSSPKELYAAGLEVLQEALPLYLVVYGAAPSLLTMMGNSD